MWSNTNCLSNTVRSDDKYREGYQRLFTGCLAAVRKIHPPCVRPRSYGSGFICRLPPEIIGQIFECGVVGTTFCEEFKPDTVFCEDYSRNCSFGFGVSAPPSFRGKVMTFQESVSQVSYRWREIALALSSIWASIAYTDGDSIPRVLLWLSRSDKQKVDFRLGFPCRYRSCRLLASAEMGQDVERILQVLACHLPRCRRIELFASCSPILSFFVAFLGTKNLSSLVSLSMKDEGPCASHCSSTPTPSLKNIVTSAHSLVNVSVIGRYSMWPGAMMGKNLMTLELCLQGGFPHPSWVDFTQTMHSCLHLRRLILRRANFTVCSLEKSLTVVILSSLEHLELQCITPYDGIEVFRRFSMPCLSSLNLRVDNGDAKALCYLLASEIHGSGSIMSRLRRLVIALTCSSRYVSMMFKEARLLRTLMVDTSAKSCGPCRLIWELASSVRELAYSFSPDSVHFGSGVAEMPGVWLPALESLAVKNAGIILHDFVRRLWDQGFCLKHLWHVVTVEGDSSNTVSATEKEWFLGNLVYWKETVSCEEIIFV